MVDDDDDDNDADDDYDDSADDNVMIWSEGRLPRPRTSHFRSSEVGELVFAKCTRTSAFLHTDDDELTMVAVTTAPCTSTNGLFCS